MERSASRRVRKLQHLFALVSLVLSFTSAIPLTAGLFSLSLDAINLSWSGYSLIEAIAPWVFLLAGSVCLSLGLGRGAKEPLLASGPLLAVGATMLLSGGRIRIYSGETLHFTAYGLVLLAAGAAGYGLLKRQDVVISVLDALGTVAMLWVIVPLVHSLPLAALLRIPLIDAFYESVMGFTGTGLTLFTGKLDHAGVYIPSVGELTPPVLLWRSLTAWVGGIGVVVMSMAVIAQPSIGLVVLTEVEGRLERIEPTVRRTAVQMFKLYLALTALSFVVFRVAGMGAFDSLCHALTGVSTQGFSTKSDSFASATLPVKLAAMAVMLLGASNFHDLYLARTRPWRFLWSVELRAMLVAIGALLLTSVGLFRLHESYGLADIAFQVVSALTTTGWQSIDLSTAPTSMKAMLLIPIFIGGSIFSTAGSVKILRYLFLFKYLKEEIKKAGMPRGYSPSLKLGRYSVSLDGIGRASLVMFLYFFAYQLGVAFAFSFAGGAARTDDLLFEVASSLGNIGLSTGIAGASLPVSMKVEFIALSIMGRLEILPLVVLFYGLASSVARRRRARRE